MIAVRALRGANQICRNLSQATGPGRCCGRWMPASAPSAAEQIRRGDVLGWGYSPSWLCDGYGGKERKDNDQ